MTLYETFVSDYQVSPDSVRESLTQRGVYDFQRTAETLRKAQNNLNGWMLDEWFGEQLGRHLWQKFNNDSQRNMLHFFNTLTSEYRFFMIVKFMEMFP